jgi:hypothetical protein
VRGRGRGWGKEGEMTQTLYAHMNKIKIKKKGGPIKILGNCRALKTNFVFCY